MKLLAFPDETYIESNNSLKLVGGHVGLLELLWIGINKSQCADLSNKDHRVTKKIKSKLREITRFKDKDEDSRVSLPGEQRLLLEDAEMEVLTKLLAANSFSALISEEYTELLDIIESSEEFKPQLMKPSLASPTN